MAHEQRYSTTVLEREEQGAKVRALQVSLPANTGVVGTKGSTWLM